VDAEAVDLEVRRGVVTLIGWVVSDNERRAIEDIAWAVDGVKEVENQLQLREENPELR
jgi:osmotically-inducible protein OsmY